MKDALGEGGTSSLPCLVDNFPTQKDKAYMMWSGCSQSHTLAFTVPSALPYVDFTFNPCFFLLLISIFSWPSLSNWLGWIQYIFSASVRTQLLLSDTIFGFLYIGYFPLIYLFLADIYQHSSEHADQRKLLSVIRLF